MERPYVLVVVDEEENFFLYERSLCRFCTVLKAVNAGEALIHATSHPFSVVITDQRMPGVSGSDLLRRLQVLQFNAVVVATQGEIMALGADGHRQSRLDR